MKRIRADEIEQVVINHFVEAAGRAGYFDEIETKLSESMRGLPKQIDDKIVETKGHLTEVSREIASTFRLQAQMSAGAEAAALASEHLEELGKQKKILENRLGELREMESLRQESGALAEIIRDKILGFKKGFPKATPATKRRLLRRVLRKLVYTGKGLEVHFNFDEAKAEQAHRAYGPSDSGKILKFKGKARSEASETGSESELNLSFEFLRVVGIGWGGRSKHAVFSSLCKY